jgi:hypothetical protein
MARPVRHDLNYFPLDVDFFDNHKVILIEEDFGVKGGYLAIRLMAMVYEKGYYLEWKDKAELSCAKRVGNGYTGALVLEILKGCLKHDMFNKELFEKHRILTSRGIQERWEQVQKGLRRKVEFEEKFWLVGKEKECVSSEVTPVSSEETAPPSEVTTAPSAESTQKEIKGKERKENNSASATPPAEGRAFKEKTKFWKTLMDDWVAFYKKEYSTEPTINAASATNLKSIIDRLEKVAAKNRVEWTEVEARIRLKEFLQKALVHSPWLKRNFLINNISSQFDAIINSNYANGTNGSHSKASAGGKSAGANQLLESLKTDLGING